jgi:hypothetical protein
MRLAMRISNLRQGIPWALAVLCATTGCLIKDAPKADARATSDAPGDRPVTDGPPAGSDGTSGSAGSAGTGTTGGTGGISDGPGGTTGGTSGSAPDGPRDVAPPDLADAAGTCTVDQHCPTTAPMCLGNVCIRCMTNDQCAGHGDGGLPVCDVTSGRCERCTPTDGCDKTSTTPVCTSSKVCGPCAAPAGGMANANCVGNAAGPLCAPAGNCVQCLQNADCRDATKPICVANKCVPCGTDAQCLMKSAAAPACDQTSGSCFECTADSFCSGVRPICNLAAHVCARCARDSECVAKLGDNPGVCMSHQDGRCATDAETVYVANRPPCAVAPAMGGTSALPYCSPQDGIGAARGVKRMVLLRGTMPFVPFNVALVDPGEISVISTDGAIIDHGAFIGIHLTRGQLYVRGVTVVGGAGAGMVADGGAASVLRLNRCKILGSAGGLAINGAGYEIVNTVIANNNEALVPPSGPTTYGGVYLRSVAGAPTIFRYNTIVGNQNIGLLCFAAYATSSLIIANNALAQFVTCAPTGAGITVDPQLDASFHLMAGAPCIGMGGSTDVPGDDIDGDPRPTPNGLSDCGADEFK